MPMFPLAPLSDADIAKYLADIQAGNADVDTVFQRIRDSGAMFHYDCKPQKEDARDFPLPLLATPSASSGGPKQWRSRIENQGQFGSCTGQGGTSVTELLAKKQGIFDGDLSRMFCYAMTRLAEGTLQEDSGASIRDTVKTLNKIGVPLESLWPYRRYNLYRKPSAAAIKAASKHRVKAYYAIRKGDIGAVRIALAAGYPVLFAMWVFKAFESLDVANHGRLALPALGEDNLGGHCIYTDWYDDSDGGYLTVPNSWGTSWGDNGVFYMPYEYFRRYTWDAWAITEDVL